MKGQILVRDCHEDTRLIVLDKVVSVILNGTYRIDGKKYPAVSIQTVGVSGSEEFSSSAIEITVIGEQALKLRDFFELSATDDFTNFSTVELEETKVPEPVAQGSKSEYDDIPF